MSKEQEPLHARSLNRPQTLKSVMVMSALMAPGVSTASTIRASTATCVRSTAKRALKHLANNLRLLSRLKPLKKLMIQQTTLEPLLVLQSPSLALLLPSLPPDAAIRKTTTLNANER